MPKTQLKTVAQVFYASGKKGKETENQDNFVSGRCVAFSIFFFLQM
jgi:hypothetical protein